MRARTCPGWRRTSSPATVALPPSMGSSVVSIRSVVVLPAPFGPRNPTISPRATCRLTPRTASIAWPRPPGKRLRSSRASMTAVMMLLPGRPWEAGIQKPLSNTIEFCQPNG